MKTIQTDVYEIHEHPNKQNVFNWIRENWTDLQDFEFSDLLKSLEAAANFANSQLDFNISESQSVHDFIRLRGGLGELAFDVLDSDECPLTGSHWDITVIQAFKKRNSSEILQAYYDACEYNKSDEALESLCEANEYHFSEEGKFYPI